MKNRTSNMSKDRLVLMISLFLLVAAAGVAIFLNSQASKHNKEEQERIALSETTQAEENAAYRDEEENSQNAFEANTEQTLVLGDDEAAEHASGNGIGEGILVENPSVNEETLPANVVPEDQTEANVPSETSAAPESSPETPVAASEEVPAVPSAASSEEQEAVTSAAPSNEQVAAAPFELTFSEDSRLIWPLDGEVIRDVSLDTTVWFPTLKQYRTSEACQIQGETGCDILCAFNGKVLEVGKKDEIGNYLTMDLGNGYTILYGNLNEICVSAGQYVSQGSKIAVLSEPTAYYMVDGSNLYLKMQKDEKVLDPMDYIEYAID